jgi:hypothetical protein
MPRKIKNKTRKIKKRKMKKQRGGNRIVLISLVVENKLSDEVIQNLVNILSQKFGTIQIISLDDNQIESQIINFKFQEWGFSKVPDNEKQYLHLFQLESPPDYFDSNCSSEAKITRFEGEIGLQLLNNNLPFQLIPPEHGLYDGNFFFNVCLREGKNKDDKDNYDKYIKQCQ